MELRIKSILFITIKEKRHYQIQILHVCIHFKGFIELILHITIMIDIGLYWLPKEILNII